MIKNGILIILFLGSIACGSNAFTDDKTGGWIIFITGMFAGGYIALSRLWQNDS